MPSRSAQNLLVSTVLVALTGLFATSANLRAEDLPAAAASAELRPDAAEQASALALSWVAQALAPPMEPGILPFGTELDRVTVEQGIVAVYLRMPDGFLVHLHEHECEDIIRQAVDVLRQVDGVSGFAVYAAPFDAADGQYRPLPAYLPEPPPQIEKPEPAPTDTRAGGLPTYNPGQPAGALSGKTIFLSPGHGWYYSTTLGRWATQRGNNYGTIEDMSNGEAVLNHLTRYFHNAGANVWPCRERDFNTHMVVIDNTSGAPAYSTSGSWLTGTSPGTPYGANFQYSAVAAAETAVATYAPDIPADGHYAVYVWTPSSSNRAIDATVRVRHTGGTTTHVINMQRDGNTWRFLGMYHFAAGRNPATGAVEISNLGSDPSKYVIADAVRFGGGMGDYPDGGSVSGKPRWEESGAYFPILMGQRTTPGSTVSAMPQYADWESESWEDSVYISWHTNASTGSGHGTSVWVYGPNGPPSPFEQFSGIAGSDSLAIRVRDEIRDDLRVAWNDPAWPAPLYSAWFGELNPSNNNEMPGILIEVAYHDNPLDVESILDPQFRDIVARAIYQGTVKWWANEADGPSSTPIADATLLPEPPTHLAVRNLGNGDVRVSWHAPPFNSGNGLLGDPATGYLVQRSTNGEGYDDGIATTATSLDVSGLTPGLVYYFRVIATNSGGQSFPSETGGVRLSPGLTAEVLVVNGFDRLDRAAMLAEDDPYDTDPVYRERLGRMNSFSYVRTFGASLSTLGIDFDYCANEAVRDGDVNLGGYAAVIWACGEESSAGATFDSAEQARVTTYLNGGGQLFVSGSEIAWELDLGGLGSTFYRNHLKAAYAANDAGTYNVTPLASSIFDGIAAFTFDNGGEIYDVDSPDVITSFGGSTAALAYSGGGAAAVVYSGAFKVVTFGFPFEAITSPARRTEILHAILDSFDLNPVDPPPPPPADIVLESRDPAGVLTPGPAYLENGGWFDSTIKSAAPGLFGTGSRFMTYEVPNAGADHAAFVPNIVTPGKYEVFVTWANGANCYDSRHTVSHYHGQTALLVDQIPSGAPEAPNYDSWISLGQYWFAAGQAPANAALDISEETVTGRPSATWNFRVYADAVKWVFVAHWPSGDYDANGVVDLADFAALPDCLTGPGAPYALPECVAFDFELDADVDLADFAAVQESLAGE